MALNSGEAQTWMKAVAVSFDGAMGPARCTPRGMG